MPNESDVSITSLYAVVFDCEMQVLGFGVK